MNSACCKGSVAIIMQPIYMLYMYSPQADGLMDPRSSMGRTIGKLPAASIHSNKCALPESNGSTLAAGAGANAAVTPAPTFRAACDVDQPLAAAGLVASPEDQ